MTNKKKRTKQQTTIYKTLHKKLKIELHMCTNPTKNWGWTHVLLKCTQPLFHWWHLSCLLVWSIQWFIICSVRSNQCLSLRTN